MPFKTVRHNKESIKCAFQFLEVQLKNPELSKYVPRRLAAYNVLAEVFDNRKWSALIAELNGTPSLKRTIEYGSDDPIREAAAKALIAYNLDLNGYMEEPTLENIVLTGLLPCLSSQEIKASWENSVNFAYFVSNMLKCPDYTGETAIAKTTELIGNSLPRWLKPEEFARILSRGLTSQADYEGAQLSTGQPVVNETFLLPVFYRSKEPKEWGIGQQCLEISKLVRKFGIAKDADRTAVYSTVYNPEQLPTDPFERHQLVYGAANVFRHPGHPKRHELFPEGGYKSGIPVSSNIESTVQCGFIVGCRETIREERMAPLSYDPKEAQVLLGNLTDALKPTAEAAGVELVQCGLPGSYQETALDALTEKFILNINDVCPSAPIPSSVLLAYKGDLKNGSIKASVKSSEGVVTAAIEHPLQIPGFITDYSLYERLRRRFNDIYLIDLQ